MLEDATHEAGYRGLVDLDDLIRHVAVRCAMIPARPHRHWVLCQAERGLAHLVEPVGEESDTVPALDLEVPDVRECGFLG